MIAFVVFAGMLAVAQCGVIHHGDDHHHATSYQHVKIENYHAVPVFVKKEHSELLEHPVSAGHVDHGVQVHHGDGHHDPGFAIASGSHHEAQQDVGHLLAGHEEIAQHEGLGAYGGHEAASLGDHQGYAGLESDDQGHEGGYEGHGSYEAVGYGGHY